ncbi:hypothetical protein [Paenibacillus sp. sgz302251]|uniref:hypothetical protein n=1 Tax=Paenibacillus sp. sgz302251 TaxID=3414493 RepID=UPI003C7EA5A5
MYNNETHNIFAAEINKLLGKSGIIHLQNDVDYRLIVQQFTGFEVSEFYDDEREPMIFKLLFLNEAGREDAIEVWDSAIEDIDLSQPETIEDWMTEGLSFVFAAVKDESTAIEFYAY